MVFFLKGALITEPAVAGAPVGIMALLAGVSATTWSYDGMRCMLLYDRRDQRSEKTMLSFDRICFDHHRAVCTFDKVVITGINLLRNWWNPRLRWRMQQQVFPLIGDLREAFYSDRGYHRGTGSDFFLLSFPAQTEYAMAKDGLFFKSFGKYIQIQHTLFLYHRTCMLAILMVFASNISDLLGYFTVVLLLKIRWPLLRFCTS